jgi:transposase
MGKSIIDLSSVTTVGLDLAKHVFQVHGVDASGRVIVAKALRRKECWPSSLNCPRVLSVYGSLRAKDSILDGRRFRRKARRPGRVEERQPAYYRAPNLAVA